ncbi:O-antigen ligase family protein [Marivirga sp.]|uniref:O-antigen ligase family protein n=1 Tax=Marivirga sp. TaxID=2018662 RepID=UPI003DA71B75
MTLKKGIILFFCTLVLWLFIDKVINNNFNDLVNVEITYYTEHEPIKFSLYYSSSELFKRDLFLRKNSELLAKNKYKVIFELKPYNINYIRIDTEFEKFNSEITINEVTLKAKENTIKLNGSEISEFVDESNDIKYELLNSGVRVIPTAPVEFADFFITLSPLEEIRHWYFGGITKNLFLNLIMIGLILIIVFKQIRSSENLYWLLISSFFFTSLFFNRPLVIASIISFIIVCLIYIAQNGKKASVSKDYFVISSILTLYAGYIIISFDLTLFKLLEYQFSLILFPFIFNYLKLCKYDVFRINLIFVNISKVIILIISLSIGLLIMETNLSLIDIIKNSSNLSKSIFGWLDNPIHPSFFSYTLFIGFLLMIWNSYERYNISSSQFNLVIWIFFYFLLMIIIGSRVSLLLTCVLILFILVKRYKINIFCLSKIQLVLIILLIGALFHLLLYNLILENLDFTRYHLWKLSLELIWQNPWMGIEYGQFGDYYREYLFTNKFNSNKIYGHPHNQFLYIGLNFGLPILVLFIFILGLTIYKSIRLKNSLLFFFLIGSLVFMSFDLLLNSLKGVVPFAFYYSFILWDNYETRI